MNTTNSAALAQLLRILSCAEDQAHKTGSADDCRTAARYCREVASQAAYADKGGLFDRSGSGTRVRRPPRRGERAGRRVSSAYRARSNGRSARSESASRDSSRDERRDDPRVDR